MFCSAFFTLGCSTIPTVFHILLLHHIKRNVKQNFGLNKNQELDEKRQEWAMYHDQKTGGITGLLPLVRDMPMRITSTDPRNKSIIFKNRRCRLFGWTLHDEDRVRLENCASPELKLEHQPKELFLRMDNATWVWSADLGPGVIAVQPGTVTWHVDKGGSKARLLPGIRLQRYCPFLRRR